MVEFFVVEQNYTPCAVVLANSKKDAEAYAAQQWNIQHHATGENWSAYALEEFRQNWKPGNLWWIVWPEVNN